MNNPSEFSREYGLHTGLIPQVLLVLAVSEKCDYAKYTCFFGLVQKIISIRKGASGGSEKS
jgi:hypothetical protein